MAHVRYIRILTRPRGFRARIANFSRVHCRSIPMPTRLEHKENQARYRPESHGVMLEFERRLLLPR